MSWNGSDKATSSPAGKSLAGGGSVRASRASRANTAIRRGLLAGLLVVALGCGALYFFTRPAPQPPDLSTPKQPNPSQIAAVAPSVPTNRPAAKPAPEDPKVAERKAFREKIKGMTPAERMEFLFEEAKKKPIDFTPSTNRLFNTGTEQIMSWIFTTKLGDPPPPLPKLSLRDEAHLAEILIAKNPALETDSERAKEAKRVVEDVKKEAIKYLKEGGNIEDFFQYYRDQLSQAYHEFTDARKVAMDMVKNGEDPDLCAEYVKKVNEKLAERGIEKKVVIPDKFYEKFSGRVPTPPTESNQSQQKNAN